MILADVMDYREAARRRIPRFLFDYVDGGAFAETTLRDNIDRLHRVRLRQRVLTGADHVSLSGALLGRETAMPLALGPVGMAGLNARRGEVQAARAAEAAGVPFCLSTVGACSIEEVRKGVQTPPWFQLYVTRDRGFMRDMIARARDAGADTLFLTVDMPAPGPRYRDKRSGLSGGTAMQRQLGRIAQVMTRPAWAVDVGLLGGPHTIGHVSSALGSGAGIDDYWAWMSKNFDASVTWDDAEEIRRLWSGRMVIKGILDPADAMEAAARGFDGVVVSNHGGRQLDGTLASIDALGPIARAVGDRMTVLMDGGIRSGLDVLRAMASGADGVLLGRAWVYGLAARGQRGVEEVLSLIAAEMRVAMTLVGVSRLDEIGPELLVSSLEQEALAGHLTDPALPHYEMMQQRMR
ncbi:L-lactate dehydrogenase [Brevundimonas subvibrioides]|uniref:L-lactate dehydrogenase (Cytochrome) n=1 Tax=Brevundimonas subvibrioides (strain ATCC 15264 / DSM 4735 / LMG 14903 / NBRC 16000 / CB 81) TaxID=633149 RepID=D9QNE8_BRESC|nr:L-lactate dehydrogenase (cytochrome) [Brevundimonas subvibrioides ATCC 15264]